MSVMASRPPNMPAGAGSKRPRLSLQIKAPSSNSSSSTSSRPSGSSSSRGFPLNPSDPTAFNTLSNAYVTAIERTSTPITSPSAEPLTAISTLQAISLSSPITLGPQAATAYPDTPLSAHPASTATPSLVMPLPSVMSPTPPMSAGAADNKVFSFSPRDAAAGRHSLEKALHAAASSAAATPSPLATPPKQQRRPSSHSSALSGSPPPYTHSKALHSILRNSPLPARRPASAPSPRPRLQVTPAVVRIQDPAQQQRASKRVCYHSPIEQEITTNTYTKSHIDLLVEEATTSTSPCSPRKMPVDLSLAFSANEIQDGGQTPGPFEDESRRLGAAMGGAGASTPTAGRRTSGSGREKKRRWVWTIGREEDADEDEEQLGGAVVAAARAAAAAAAGGENKVAAAPVLAVPKPKRKLDTATSMDVDMS